jgi:hypothetical protein
MSDRSEIVSFMHCGRCIRERGRAGIYEVGLVDEWTLRVWCSVCDNLVGDFDLANPMEPRCDMHEEDEEKKT